MGLKCRMHNSSSYRSSFSFKWRRSLHIRYKDSPSCNTRRMPIKWISCFKMRLQPNAGQIILLNSIKMIIYSEVLLFSFRVCSEYICLSLHKIQRDFLAYRWVVETSLLKCYRCEKNQLFELLESWIDFRRKAWYAIGWHKSDVSIDVIVSTNIFDVEFEQKPVVKCFMLVRYHDLTFFVIQCTGFFNQSQ